jgi:hypothetical protein
MRLIAAIAVFYVVAGCGAVSPENAQLTTSCDPTRPNGDTPPGEESSAGHHGNGRLYTALWLSGEILADPSYVEADGSIGMKFPWWRAAGVGAAGDLQITGHEISTQMPIKAAIPEAYGQRFQATGVTFPAEGCYEITGRSGDAQLTFVTKVKKVAVPSAAP